MDLPYDGPTYLHRIGRAGRYGSHGLAITIIQDNEELEQFQKMLYEIGGDNFNIMKFPTGKIPYDIWSMDKSDWEKVSSVVGEYKYVKVKEPKEVCKEPEIDAKDGNNAESKAIMKIYNNRIISSGKKNFDDYAALAKNLAEFKIDNVEEMQSFKQDELKLNDTSSDLLSSLIFLESSGKRFFNESFENLIKGNELIKTDVETGVNSQDNLPNLPKIVDASDSDEGVESDENESEDEIEESDDEDEESKSESDVKFNNYYKSYSNWYDMWYRQLIAIRQYSLYINYWNEMMNFR